MYPQNYFALFPAFPRRERVFVAMSFDARFEDRWQKVIQPAIQMVVVNGIRLEPLRVDMSNVSDSILTEILGGIATSRLIFADISTIDFVDEKPYRNGNVMYELGLAHATRLPQEVLIFRSDQDRLLFDVTNIRISSYDPDKRPEEARQMIAEGLTSAIREIDLQRHLAVRHAVSSLDFDSWMVLSELSNRPMQHPQNRFGKDDETLAIYRLLELGAIRSSIRKAKTVDVGGLKAIIEDKPDWLTYELTAFGGAILGEATARFLEGKEEI